MNHKIGEARASAIVHFLVALIAAIAIQFAHGAYTAPMAGFPDEPAHVVTTLMYRQFLLAPSADPLEFAKNYYSHYPFLAAGQWPPGFHLPAAIWTVLVGAGKTQLILYLALVSALTGMLLYRCIRSLGSPLLSIVFVAMWMMLSQSQAAITRFMAEMPLALLTLAAVVVYVRYLRSPSYRLAALFAALAAAAMLTKESAISLAFVPPLCVVATRRWGLLRKGHFWLPAVVVSSLSGGWHVWVAALGVGRLEFGNRGLISRVLINSDSSPMDRLLQFSDLLGWPVLLLAIIGLIVRLTPLSPNRESSVDWIAHGSLVAGGVFFHLVLPESKEARHLYQLSPSLMLLAAAGAWGLTHSLQVSLRANAAVLIGILAVLFSPSYFALSGKLADAPIDLASIARYICADATPQTVLLSTSALISEGPLIAEVALLEPIPHRRLLRASKTIYHSLWNGTIDDLLISNPGDLRRFIDGTGIDAIVRLTGQTQTRRPDEAMLSLVIAEHPDDWTLAVGDVDGAQIYRRIRSSDAPRDAIRIRMGNRLGEDLVVAPDGSAVEAAPQP